MPIHGYVTAFSRLGGDGANTYYQLRFNSFLALLRLGSDRRDWIETPAQQTVSDVLGKYPQAAGNFTWQLRQALRSYSQRMQWESDWNYVHRTFEELGLFPRFDIAQDGKSHKVVIMDDLFSAPELKRKPIFCLAAQCRTKNSMVLASGSIRRKFSRPNSTRARSTTSVRIFRSTSRCLRSIVGMAGVRIGRQRRRQPC